MITPIVRTKGGAFSLLFDVTEEELEVATVLRDLHTYVEAEARGVPLKRTTETSSYPWGAKRIRTSAKKPSSQSPSTVPTPPLSVPSTSGGTGVRDEKTNSSFPLSSSRSPPPTQSVPYTSGPPTVPLSQSSPSPQTQAVPPTSGRPSVRVEARTTSFPRNGANDLNHNRLNKTAPARKKKKKKKTKEELLETVENLTKSNEFLVLEIEKRKLELKKKAAINEFLKAKKQNLSSAIDGSKTSPEPSTVPQLGILKLLATETEKRKLELEKKAAINELLKEKRQNLRSTIECSKTPPEKTTVPHVGIPKLYLHIRNGQDQRHEHVMGHQEQNESNPTTAIAGPDTRWHSSEDGETRVLAASIRAIPNQKPSLSEVLWNRKDPKSVQAASGEARHDRMVTKKEEMNKNGSLVTKKEEMNKNGRLVTKKEEMNKNGSLVTKKEEMNKNGSLVTKKEEMNKNGSLVTKKEEMNKNGSLVTKKEEMNKNGSLVTKKEEMNKNGSLVIKKEAMNKEEMNKNGSLVTKKEEMNKNGSLVIKKEAMNKNGNRFVNFLSKGCL